MRCSSNFPSQIKIDEEHLFWGTARGVLFKHKRLSSKRVPSCHITVFIFLILGERLILSYTLKGLHSQLTDFAIVKKPTPISLLRWAFFYVCACRRPWPHLVDGPMCLVYYHGEVHVQYCNIPLCQGHTNFLSLRIIQRYNMYIDELRLIFQILILRMCWLKLMV